MKPGDMVRELGSGGDMGVILRQSGHVPYLPKNRFFTVMFSNSGTRTVTETLLEVIQ